MRQPSVEDIVQTIAVETNTAADTDSKMYVNTWATYSDGAKVRDFLTVLVVKRVKEKLRASSQARH